ncbi:C40 family peptidase [Paraburkholderia sp. USG1]|uniref:C40 family peptidase n=1 Tax=Paraburkholderia sp. USG1 TaxID=2952268 RepID=UPI0028657A46|nr:Mov34/MPN/PAD-1 family protein [Paraburkholderia sp. USG1]MDR8400119.1 C40 family peptidase [Paraburkholderia sp. USG1]
MDERIRAAIADHALAEHPREACGLVVVQDGHETYVRCRNVASTPSEHFVMSAEDYARAEDLGEIVAVVHSHPGAPARPSAADVAMCEQSGVARWAIVSLGVQADGSIGIDDWCEFGPTGFIAPLLGRQFVHGVHDCYDLVRSYYQLERGVTLPDFDRPDGWWADGVSNLFLDNVQRAGFEDMGQTADLKVGDVLLMQIRSKNGVPNHSGIYLGDNVLLHHMYGQLSGRTVWGGMWAHGLRNVLRYKG